MSADGPDVHTSHCCVIHGCKYAIRVRSQCSVLSGKKVQEYLCEFCTPVEDIVADIVVLERQLAQTRALAERIADTYGSDR